MTAPGEAASASCPPAAELEALLAPELDYGREQALRRHVAKCDSCADKLVAIEPSYLFATMPRRTLSEQGWQPVMAAVRAAIAADQVAAPSPDRAGPAGAGRTAWLQPFTGWLQPLRLAGAAAALALLLLSAVLLLPSDGVHHADGSLAGHGEPSEAPAPDRILASEGARVELFDADAVADSSPNDFKLWSHPQAQVAHLLMAEADGPAEVVTMVMIDDGSLDGLF